MLGRLFQASEELDPVTDKPRGLARRLSALAISSLSNSPTTPPPTEKIQSVPSNYTNEDSYSRTVLYGTPNDLTFTKLELFQYRLLIVQDKGELLHRNNYKVCFDSAKDHHFDKAGAQKLLNRHTVDELIEFMFGNPIHQDIAISDRSKIHRLSPLKDLPESMLITKYFKVSKRAFAIAVVVPVSSSHFSEAILSNWCQISTHLNLAKTTYIQNHIQRKNPAVSQNFLDIAILFKQLIISINNLVSIPRLLLGLTDSNQAMFDHWCYELQNWIEIKDGARTGLSGTRFLPTLLTIVNSLKYQLVNRDYSDEFVRVVIMAQNPIVAQKLIFIISGILPFDNHLRFDTVPESNTTTEFVEDEYQMATKFTPPTPSVINNGWEIPTTPSRSIATPSVMKPTRSSVIQPLSTSQSMAYLSSSLQSHSSFSNSLSRGLSFLQNWKGPLDSTSPANSTTPPSMSYHSPSPNREYDEYPWTDEGYTTGLNSTAATTQPIAFTNPLPRSFSSYEVPGSYNSNKKFANVPRLPHIERNTTTVYGVGVVKTEHELNESTRRECQLLMHGTVDSNVEVDDLKNVSIMNVLLEDDDDDEADGSKTLTPPPLCGYLNEFVPEFQLQACPISPDLESKVASAMKSDLQHYQNSRTIFVSLRAREIREFVMIKGEKEIKTHVRKLYGNMKPSLQVDKVGLGKIETTLEVLLSGRDISSMVKEW